MPTGQKRPAARLLASFGALAFVVTLGAPLAQQMIGYAPRIGLGGAVDEPPIRPPMALASWHDGALQRWWEQSIDRELGLRDWMVRLDNQLKFSLFGVAKHPVVAGPGGWMVEAGYLPARTHLQPHQVSPVLARLHEVLQAQCVLAEHGVTMLLLISPSKAETLPQHLPLAQRVVAAARHRRTLDLVRGVLGFGVLNHLDAQALFEQWRDVEPDFPLFARAGTHWSRLAAARIAAHLLDELERLSGVDVVNLDLAPRVMGDRPGPSEDDMALLANLLDPADCSDPMPLPNVVRRPGDQGKPQGVLLVSSSFAWTLAAALEDAAVTSRLAVYYYFRGVTEWVDGRRTEKRPLDFTPEQLRAEVLRYRFVVLECNVSMIPGLGFGFPAAILTAFGAPRSVPPITTGHLESLKPLLVPGQR